MPHVALCVCVGPSAQGKEAPCHVEVYWGRVLPIRAVSHLRRLLISCLCSFLAPIGFRIIGQQLCHLPTLILNKHKSMFVSCHKKLKLQVLWKPIMTLPIANDFSWLWESILLYSHVCKIPWKVNLQVFLKAIFGRHP